MELNSYRDVWDSFILHDIMTHDGYMVQLEIGVIAYPTENGVVFDVVHDRNEGSAELDALFNEFDNK